MGQNKPLIYLVDLTHTGQIVAANVAPLGIGLIGAYLKRHLSFNVNLELFKYPKDLDTALNDAFPNIIGFANYSWNCEISYKFTKRIKELSPQTIIIFGGPNYGLTKEEMEEFWSLYPLIDFCLVKEGEIAFVELLEAIYKNNFDIEAIKNLDPIPKNCHFLKDGQMLTGELLPRIKSLDEIGSPYLDGLMDKFFDGILIPMVHTTRGCPFTCAFCTEGNPYYSKVAQRYDLKDELVYIAERRKSVQDLVITDANFGMYKEDEPKARILADIQAKHGWPTRIQVSTGKNQKERIIEVTSILNGAVSIAASLQSTDEAILKNIKRSNISTDALKVMVEKSAQANSPNYTEIILCLPGDSLKAHTQTLRDVVDTGLGVIRMYQLILLPQTELNTPETRKKFGMQTKFRINPRSFGKYPMLGKDVFAIEMEEICVANSTMSSEDYFNCRELDLSVEILHNTGMFLELLGLCKWLGDSWFEVIYKFYEKRRFYFEELTNLYDRFTSDSKKRLWDTRQELEEHVESNFESYLNDPYGTNEMAFSKAIAFFYLQDKLHEILFKMMEELLDSHGKLSDLHKLYLQELMEYSKLRKKDFTNSSIEHIARFHFDFIQIKKEGFKVDPKNYFNAEGYTFRFHHSKDQKEQISSYVMQYGTTVDGLGRILMRAPIRTLFRDIEMNSRHNISAVTVENFG